MNSIRNISFYFALAIGVFACQAIKAMDMQKKRALHQQHRNTYDELLKKHSENVRLICESIEQHKQRAIQYDQENAALNEKISKFNKKTAKLTSDEIRLKNDQEASQKSNGKCQSTHIIAKFAATLEERRVRHNKEEHELNAQKKVLKKTERKIDKEEDELTERFTGISKSRDALVEICANLIERYAKLYPDDVMGNTIAIPEQIPVSMNRIK